MVGLHNYPKPDKNHPVSASEAAAGLVTLECPRCLRTRTIKWNPGPPKPDNDPPLEGFMLSGDG